MDNILAFAGVGIRHGEERVHSHAYAELYVSLEGRGTNVVNGVESDTVARDVFVLSKDMTHGQRKITNYKYCIFKFDMDALCNRAGALLSDKAFQALFIVEPQLKREGAGAVNMQVDSLTSEFAEKCAEVLTNMENGQLADTLFLSLVSLIVSRVHPYTSDSASARDKLAEVVSYMESSYAEPLTLARLASIAGYSERHLTRLFISVFGTGPIEHLRLIRLRKSLAMLTETGMNIAEIAVASGFADSSSYSKLFRRRFGVSPSMYRARRLDGALT